MVVSNLYKHYIRGTEKGAIVQLVQVILTSLTVAVSQGLSSSSRKVYISTRVLKHLYDKRPAEEFDFLIHNVHLIVRYPDTVYKNKVGKRGSYCFIKELKNTTYFCSIEEIEKDGSTALEVATFFRTDNDYLASYELLWEWKGGDLHRSAFDSGLTQPNRTPQ